MPSQHFGSSQNQSNQLKQMYSLLNDGLVVVHCAADVMGANGAVVMSNAFSVSSFGLFGPIKKT